MNLKKLTILLFFVFTLIDFLSSIYLLSFGYIEMNLIYAFIGNYFWFLYWIISLGILFLLYKTKIVILNIVTFSHLICSINNIGLII